MRNSTKFGTTIQAILILSLLGIGIVSASLSTVYNPFTGKLDYIYPLTSSDNVSIGELNATSINMNGVYLGDLFVNVSGDTMTGDLITHNLKPPSSNTYDLGATNNFYRNAYFQNWYGPKFPLGSGAEWVLYFDASNNVIQVMNDFSIYPNGLTPTSNLGGVGTESYPKLRHWNNIYYSGTLYGGDVSIGNLDMSGDANITGNLTLSSDPTLPYHAATKNYVDIVASAFGIRFYTTDSIDGDTGYYKGTLSIPSYADHTITVSSLTDDELIATWITESGASLDKVIRGLHEGVLFAEKTSGTKDLRVYFRLYERLTNTSEVLIGMSMNSGEIDTLDAYVASMLLDKDYNLSTGSRLVLKIYADVSSGGSAPEITIHSGTDYHSYIQVPTNLEVLEDIFVPYSGATNNVNLGNKNITTSNTMIITNGTTSWNIYVDENGTLNFMVS